MTTKFNRHDIVRHVKTGNLYYIVATPDTCRIEADNSEAYAYEELAGQDKKLWVRPKSEMEDGRFKIHTQSQSVDKLTVSELMGICPFLSPEVTIFNSRRPTGHTAIRFMGYSKRNRAGIERILADGIGIRHELDLMKREMEHYINQEESK